MGIRIVLFMSMGVSLLVIALSEPIALELFHLTELISVLKIIIIAVPFNAVTVVILFATVGFKTMKYRVYARDLIEPLFRVLIALFVFSLGWKIFGALFAFISSIVMSAIFAFVFLKKLSPSIFQKKPTPIYETKALIGFSWPLLFVKMLDFLIFWIGILMLGYFRTSHDVGIYGPTQRTAILLWIIFTCFNSIFAPIISDLYNRKELGKLGNLFKIVTKWIFSFSLPGFILLIFYSEEILYLWGKEFVEGSLCLIILSAAYLFLSAVGPVRHMIMMSGRTKINLINSIIGFISVISLNLVLVPKYGMIGAAVATAFSICVVSVLGLVEVYVILKMHPFRLDFLKPLIAGGVSLLILIFSKDYLFNFGQPHFSLLVGGFILLASYTAILILLRLEDEDRIIIDKIRQKLMKLSQ
jgi:O-antigen/teichoic acid export membrane protein